MKVVLDASAAVTSLMDETSAPAVFTILDEADDILAPAHYLVEVTSGLWKYVITRRLSIEDALRRLNFATRLVWTYHDVESLAHEVLREASVRRHSVYDLYYAVLARREKAAILTFDRRLKQLCSVMGIPRAVE